MVMLAWVWFGCATPRAEAPLAVSGPTDAGAVAPLPSVDADQRAPGSAMRRHQAFAAAVVDAVSHGDLDGARAEAKALESQLSFDGVPEVARAQALWVIDAARDIGSASDLPAAARGVGDLAAACGGCHSALGASVAITEPPPVEGDGLRGEMAQHQRAVDRLWAGLIRPSAADLDAGVGLLRATSLSIPGGTPAAAAAMDDAATDAAARLAAAAPEDRAARFGELLLVCAGCHTARPGGVAIEPE
jgi:cytochrome c553